MDHRGARPWLVTGFEPFDGPVNATDWLVRSLEADPPPELQAVADALEYRVLPVRTKRIAGALAAALEETRPAGVVLLGESARAAAIEVERRAFNRLEFTRPDCDGCLVTGEPVEPGGPDEVATSLPDPAGLVAAVRAVGVPAALSDDAGRYLCNQVFYLARRAFDGPAGFVHVPRLPRQRDDPAAGPALDEGRLRRGVAALLRRLVGGAAAPA